MSIRRERLHDPRFARGPSGWTAGLYAEFRRRLRVLLEAGSKRPREVEETLDLVPGQARKWLERTEQDGEVERVSGRPVKFSLSRRSRA